MTKEECEIETSKAIMEMRSHIAELEKENAELQEKISILLSCKNCPENKGGWVCVKEYENKCLTQKIVYIKELEKEKCELLGIIQGKDKVIQELEKENEELINENTELKVQFAMFQKKEREQVTKILMDEYKR